MIAAILAFSGLMLILVGWVLRTNARDRKRLEKELEDEFADEHEDRF